MRLIGDRHGNFATAYRVARKIEPLSMWVGVHIHRSCATPKHYIERMRQQALPIP